MLHIVQNSSHHCIAQTDVTKEWHKAYADLHGYQYHLLNKAVTDRHGAWAKVLALQEVLATLPIGDEFVFIDSDAVIKVAAKDVRLIDVLPVNKDIGLVKLLPGFRRSVDVAYYNTGVIFGYKTNDFDTFLKTAWDQGAVATYEAGEEPRFNLLLNTLKFQEVGSEFNNYGWTARTTKQIVIRSFHGETDKRRIPSLLKRAMNIADF